MAKISIEQAIQRLVGEDKQENLQGSNEQGIKKAPKAKKTNIEYVSTLGENGNVFMFKKDVTFILSPADDTLEPIIAELDEAPDISNSELPPCFQDWICEYNDEIENYQTNSKVEKEENDIVSASLEVNDDDFVDLGLSVRWAKKNIGAESETDFGEYYCWGETEPNTKYSFDSYKYYEKLGETCKDIGENISKNVQYDVVFLDDRSLCMPTIKQWKELFDNCKITKATLEGKTVLKVTGKNDNFIYLPLNGYFLSSATNAGKTAEYWTSEECATDKMKANGIKISDNKPTVTEYRKRTGLCVRGVGAQIPNSKTTGRYNLVDLGLSVKWADKNVGANSPYEVGSYFAWGETEFKKTNFEWSNYQYYIPASETCKFIGENITGTEYDVSFVTNENYYMPTEEQVNELIEGCKWTKTKVNNINVWKVEGPNGNSIIIPINGCKYDSKLRDTTYTYLWTSTYQNDNQMKAKSLRVSSSPSILVTNRRTGAAIRPITALEDVVGKKKNIEPFVNFKWGQGSPYNMQLQIDPATKKTSITGCTNTAIAEIMAYWGCVGLDGNKYKRGCKPSSAYISNKGNKHEISIPALGSITVFDYDNLLTTRTLINKSEKAKKAVSEMMKHIGYSTVTNYSSGNSSTSCTKALNVLKNRVRMGMGAKLISASSGISEFADKVYENLAKSWPVMMMGWNQSGGGGHSFVVDGYNASTDKFHFNWGWDGQYNGWFALSSLTPTNSDEFSYYKKAIVDICPDYILGDTNDDKKVDIKDIMNVINNVIAGSASKETDLNSDGKVDEEDVKIIVDFIWGLKKCD